ncbi:diphthamide synthesis protein [Candidatus Woesearchaeota archaeon]|nr:diphthamide synthesis protein [Candidatus Woesearchaeota archaeon]
MDIMFIEAKYKGKIKLPSGFTKKLPKTIGLFTTVQFVDSIALIQKQLEENNIKVKFFKTGHAKYKGQLLGCNIEEFKGVEAFVYIGDGMFHPKALVLKNKLPVFVFNPLNKKTGIITHQDVEILLRKQKGAYLKFLDSVKVGVLISVKPGQNRLKTALKLKSRYPDKEFFYLIADNIDFSQLENFPFIECFVNTACPRLGLDDSISLRKPIINLELVL